jgi:hypothetical protein
LVGGPAALGIAALLGIDAETGVFMLLYLDLAYKKPAAKPAISRASISTRPSWKEPPSVCAPSS